MEGLFFVHFQLQLYLDRICLVCTVSNENIVDASEVQTNGFSNRFIQVLDTGEDVHKIIKCCLCFLQL